MLKKMMLVMIAAVLLAGVENLIAQDKNDEAQAQQIQTQRSTEQGTQSGQDRPGAMRDRFGMWFDELTKAYEQKDLEKIGQLLEDMKQRRERFQGDMGQPRDRSGRGREMFGRSGASSVENPPILKTEQEKKILNVLDDMEKNQSRGMMNVPIEDGRLLRLLTEAVGAKHVVEIGTSNGYSGIWLCLALQNTGGKLSTYEIDAQRAALARENFKRASVDKIVTLIKGDAHKEVTKLKEPIDVLFIDADKEGYIDYFKKLLPLVRPGGLILAHNINMRGQMQDFIEAVTTDPNVETVFQGLGQDLSVTLKKRLNK